jgi:hypothetical protein
MFALDIELNLIINWRKRESQLGVLHLPGLFASPSPALMLELRREVPNGLTFNLQSARWALSH